MSTCVQERVSSRYQTEQRRCSLNVLSLPQRRMGGSQTQHNPSPNSSKKQHIIALSSTKLEYIAQAHAMKEALWLRSFINKIQGPQGKTIVINCDNQGAIGLAKDNKFHSRTKHIDLCYHFIREAVEENKITMEYIPTGENVADIFTKALPRPKFMELAEGSGLGIVGKERREQ